MAFMGWAGPISILWGTKSIRALGARRGRSRWDVGRAYGVVLLCKGVQERRWSLRQGWGEMPRRDTGVEWEMAVGTMARIRLGLALESADK